MEFLTNEEGFLRLQKDKLWASPSEVVVSLLANKANSLENVKELLGEQNYKDKIQMLQHQKAATLKVLNEFTHRALLADEVGLGKTIEAGMILKEYIVRKLASKILILTPATLTLQWQEELRSKFDEDFFVANKPEDWDMHDKIIASIDTAKTERNAKLICSQNWDLLVVDEAHKLKNKQTLNYKFVKKIPKQRFLMLTATPLQNNIFELWNMLDLLHPGFLGTSKQFKDQYIRDNKGLEVQHGDELRKKLGRIMIRTLRKHTNIKFVDRKIETILLDYTSEQLKWYQDVLIFVKKQYVSLNKEEKKSVESSSEDSEEIISQVELKQKAREYQSKGILGFRLIMLTRQISSSFRTGVKALERYSQDIDEEMQQKEIQNLVMRGKQFLEDQKTDMLIKLIKKAKTKVIVFTTFLESQKNLLIDLAMQNISAIGFNGTMNLQEKEAAINLFRNDVQVLVCTDSGSEGRNLQFAYIIVNYDLPWNPMRVEQRIGRVHRIGQEHDVHIINLAFNDTVEAYILNRLYEKIDLFKTAVGDMDTILAELKTTKSFETMLFESFITADTDKEAKQNVDKVAEQLKDAKNETEKIKSFDEKIFGELHIGDNHE